MYSSPVGASADLLGSPPLPLGESPGHTERFESWERLGLIGPFLAFKGEGWSDWSGCGLWLQVYATTTARATVLNLELLMCPKLANFHDDSWWASGPLRELEPTVTGQGKGFQREPRRDAVLA